MQMLRNHLGRGKQGAGDAPPAPQPPTSPSTGRPQPAAVLRQVGQDQAGLAHGWQRSFEALAAAPPAEGREARLEATARCAELCAELERIARELPGACRAAGLDGGEVSRLLCAKLFLRFELPGGPGTAGSLAPGSSDASTAAPAEEVHDGEPRTCSKPHLSRVRTSVLAVSTAAIEGRGALGDVAPEIPENEEVVEDESGIVVANKFAFVEETRKKKSLKHGAVRHPLYAAMVEGKGDFAGAKQAFEAGPVNLETSLDRDAGLPVPLLYAIAPLGSLALVDLLLQRGADVDCRWHGPGEWCGIEEGLSATEAARHLAKADGAGPDLNTIVELLVKKQTVMPTRRGSVMCSSTKAEAGPASMFYCKHIHGHPDQLYELDRQVGAGTFGSVRLATHKQSGQIHAVKACPKDLIPEDELWAEIEVMQQLDHPHIARLYYTFEDDKHIFVSSEMCSGGELFDAIIEAGYFSEKIGARLFKQALSAVTYIHFKHICHRDLKPENYLLNKKGSLDDVQVKLIDFGTAKRFDLAPMTTKVCTVHYVAPEVLKRSMDPYTEKVDVWSLGVMLFVMICGVAPFESDSDIELMKMIKKGKWDFKPEAVWSHMSAEAKDLVSSMLCVKVDKRLSANDALHHVWCTESATTDAAVVDQSTIKQMKTFVAHSRLKKVALQIIARQVSDDTIQQMRDLFLAIDEDNSGSLTMDEMDEAFAALAISEAIRLEMRQVMSEIDVDGNGSINYTEFIAATMKKQDYMKEEVCRAAFHVFDINGDGVICKDDLATLLSQFEENAEDGHATITDISEVAEILREADSNGDGQLEFEEFMHLMADRTMEKITAGSGQARGSFGGCVDVKQVKTRISERRSKSSISMGNLGLKDVPVH